MLFKKSIYFFSIFISFFACVKPYDLDFTSQKEILFIEADLNDFDEEQFISLKINSMNTSGINFINIENALVEVIENKETKIKCNYRSDGKYYLPLGFKVKLNVPYQVKFILNNGSTFESKIEIATEVPEIKQVTSVFKSKGILFKNKLIDGHEIYIDTFDNPGIENYYFWAWRHFESQSYCRSCDGGLYYTTPSPEGRCVDDANLKRRGVIYDYTCRSICWDVTYNDDLNIMSDAFSNGKIIEKRLLAKIPFYQYKGSLIEAQQISISKSAYNYFKLVIDQTQNSGSLADTPPAGLIGNVTNVKDPTQAIGGYFMVSSKKIKRFWIKRDEKDPTIKVFGTLNGRIANPEPSGNDLTRPPQAPCLEDKLRTSKRPFGWID
jgi:hypothetical protein